MAYLCAKPEMFFLSFLLFLRDGFHICIFLSFVTGWECHNDDFTLDLKSTVINEHVHAKNCNTFSLHVSKVPSLYSKKIITDGVP